MTHPRPGELGAFTDLYELTKRLEWAVRIKVASKRRQRGALHGV
jgi:hypothetical protein